ncbi:MAG TPA: hypothetical protein VMB74_15290 [Streptosporangiaceae bacterium]|nr:hypothetical protein [Streptosporangiaceae bacterium]
MIDDELITVLLEQRGKVVMTTPVEQIINRGHAVRNRHRVHGVVAAAGAAAAAVVVTVSVALPASRPAGSHPAASHLPAGHPANLPSARLTAWTVTRLAGGSIRVTFREAADAAGLQRTLRADGVPVSVTFTGQQNPACQPYSAGTSQAFWPFGPSTGPLGGARFIANPKDAYTTPYALVIDPSALPSGAGLQISTSGTPGPTDSFQLDVSLVQASAQCTGG